MNEPAPQPAYEQITGPQRKFVDLLLTGLTGAEAIRRMRPMNRRPDSLAWHWRKMPLVRKAIEERQSDAMELAGITHADILLDIANFGKVTLRALTWQEGEKDGVKAGTPKKLHELDDITARAIQSAKIAADGSIDDVRFVDKLAAKKLLGQYKRLFTESHEINLGEKTIEQLVEASWNRGKPPGDDTPPAAGL